MYKIATYLAYFSCLTFSLALPSRDQIALPEIDQSKVLSALDQTCVHWEPVTSKHGKPFEIGKPVLKNDIAVMDKQDFGIDVNWPVGDTTWKYLSQADAATTGITRYRLYPSTSDDYAYELDFTNTEHYDYQFWDQTGDYYGVNTFRDGDHYVRYDSNLPKIVYIRGD